MTDKRWRHKAGLLQAINLPEYDVTTDASFRLRPRFWSWPLELSHRQLRGGGFRVQSVTIPLLLLHQTSALLALLGVGWCESGSRLLVSLR